MLARWAHPVLGAQPDDAVAGKEWARLGALLDHAGDFLTAASRLGLVLPQADPLQDHDLWQAAVEAGDRTAARPVATVNRA